MRFRTLPNSFYDIAVIIALLLFSGSAVMYFFVPETQKETAVRLEHPRSFQDTWWGMNEEQLKTQYPFLTKMRERNFAATTSIAGFDAIAFFAFTENGSLARVSLALAASDDDESKKLEKFSYIKYLMVKDSLAAMLGRAPEESQVSWKTPELGCGTEVSDYAILNRLVVVADRWEDAETVVMTSITSEGSSLFHWVVFEGKKYTRAPEVPKEK